LRDIFSILAMPTDLEVYKPIDRVDVAVVEIRQGVLVTPGDSLKQGDFIGTCRPTCGRGINGG